MGNFCKAKNGDWFKVYQDWNLLTLQVRLILFVIDLVMALVACFNTDATAFMLVPWLVLGFISAFLSGWIGWLCIVRKRGCCGDIGFLIWAGVHFLNSIARLSVPRVVWWINILQCFPSFAMCWACFKLFQSHGASERG